MNNPLIWITRTQPAAAESAKLWRAVGADVMTLPLLNVVSVEMEPPPHVGGTLIFTSKNGVDYFSHQSRDFPAICVGDATADHARAAGFADVVSVDGTSTDITKYVLDNLPMTQTFTHISGRHVRGTIVEDLRLAGYAATRQIVYRSEPILRQPERVPTHVALYSPLAAKTFAQLPNPPMCTALSISPATDAALAGLSLAGRRVAARPTEVAMLALLHAPAEG